ncbi:MAG: ABC transporter substrate-binding protein [Sporichthyaceae bacterium]
MTATLSRANRRRGGVTVACAVALTLSGCGGRGDVNPPAAAPTAGTSGAPAAAGEIPKFEYAIDNAATGPAPATPGAQKGGTVRMYAQIDYEHLDPARIYSNTEGELSNSLLTRTLTGWREEGLKSTLVGDLATDTGRTSDGGKTWTFTLRDNLLWEDGQPIKSADIKYGLERTFVKDYAEGPTYIQRWLTGRPDYHSVYEGPYDGKSLDAIATPDDKTLVLNLAEPVPDLPYAMAFAFASPVRKDKDTKGQYTQKPFSSGPYRIESRQIDKSMTLVRNDNWKPETDPLRTAYPDRWDFVFGDLPLSVNQKLIGATSGDDAAAVTTNGVSPEVLSQVLSTPDLVNRTISNLTTAVGYVNINNNRVKDLRVRKAIMYAYPRAQARQVSGGPDVGEFASTLSSPTLVGHEKYDLFNVPPEGDPEKAKELLREAGQEGRTLVYGYGGTPRGEQIAVAVTAGLERAGFKVVKKPLNPKTSDQVTSDKDNELDIYGAGWLQDWPSGYTVFPPLFDGREIRKGGYNRSFFNDPAINAEMDEIAKIADPVEAGRRWSQIDRKIMAQVPAFPTLYSRSRHLYGPRMGGVRMSNLQGLISFDGLYVKP